MSLALCLGVLAALPVAAGIANLTARQPTAADAVEVAASAGWKPAAPPSGYRQPGELESVACPSVTLCFAAGIRSVDSQTSTLAVTDRDGSWTTETSPNIADATGADAEYVGAIACPAISDCWVVGSYEGSQGYLPLFEQGDGSTWTLVAGPTTPTLIFDQAVLHGVTCLSVSDCWAVGASDGTLTEHFDGTAWSIVPSANSGTADQDVLNAVTCTSASACWAVGQQNRGTTGASNAGQTLIEFYNGTSWSVVPSPNPLRGGDELLGVACPGAGLCWAVGTVGTGKTGYDQPLVERLSQGHWTAVQSHLPLGGFLPGVACSPGGPCWAVGANNKKQKATLIERLEGSKATAELRLPGLGLNSVACPAAGSCWAVGPLSGSPKSGPSVYRYQS
jgi:hypothetical protein